MTETTPHLHLSEYCAGKAGEVHLPCARGICSKTGCGIRCDCRCHKEGSILIHPHPDTYRSADIGSNWDWEWNRKRPDERR